MLLKYPQQSPAVDIWSAGVIFLCILSGRYPFFRAYDDMLSLAQIMTLCGTSKAAKAAFELGMYFNLISWFSQWFSVVTLTRGGGLQSAQIPPGRHPYHIKNERSLSSAGYLSEVKRPHSTLQRNRPEDERMSARFSDWIWTSLLLQILSLDKNNNKN